MSFKNNTIFTIESLNKLVEKFGLCIVIEFKSDYNGLGFEYPLSQKPTESDVKELNELLSKFESELMGTDEFDFTIYNLKTDARLNRITKFKNEVSENLLTTIICG